MGLVGQVGLCDLGNLGCSAQQHNAQLVRSVWACTFVSWASKAQQLNNITPCATGHALCDWRPLVRSGPLVRPDQLVRSDQILHDLILCDSGLVRSVTNFRMSCNRLQAFNSFHIYNQLTKSKILSQSLIDQTSIIYHEFI